MKILKDIKDALKDGGFLIIVTRYRLTDPEIALKTILNEERDINLEKYINAIENLGLNIIGQKSDTIGNNSSTLKKN